MRTNDKGVASLLMTIMAVFMALGICVMPEEVKASGGGGSTHPAGLAGNWSGTITTSFGTGAFTMKISQSAGSLTGSVHFGAPIFDSTLKLVANTVDGFNFAGWVSNGEGSLPITGVMSADGSTITGTVVELQQVWTFVVTRN